MWLPGAKESIIQGRGKGNGLVAVAVEKDKKGSRQALKWAADTLLSRGQTLVLIHVLHTTSSPFTSNSPTNINMNICNCNNHSFNLLLTFQMYTLLGGMRSTNWPITSPKKDKLVNVTKDLFETFHCYCSRKDIHCLDVVLQDMDVVKGITEYVYYAAIENLVVGAASRHGFIRFKTSTPSSILKGAPDFCSVYVISKGRISSVRSAARRAPHASPLQRQIETLNDENGSEYDTPSCRRLSFKSNRVSPKPIGLQSESMNKIQSGRRSGTIGRLSMDFAEHDSDISFVSSDRPSSVRSSSVFYDHVECARNGRTSTSSDHSWGSTYMKPKFTEPCSPDQLFSEESSRTSLSSLQHNEEVEADVRRLRLELKQTMEMYSNACKEALTAQQKLLELHNWRIEEEKKLEDARVNQEAAEEIAEKEKEKSKAAKETAEMAKRLARLETKRRANVEGKYLKEAEEMRKALKNLQETDKRYRKYTLEEIEKATNEFSEAQKIGEGGYGPVYKCYLDHTAVAVKVLRAGSAQGETQFQQELNILGTIRHPNMVLLVGACPEEGVLIYEYMENGSLEDCLFGKKEEMMSWELRFEIAAEIATGLLFLHQTKPEPLVHRDLKPANILLDHNYVSKISDVGLARLLPAAVAENETQCRMTAAAGTFCYIDPEYQQTGMLGVKSDVYSLGIVILQLLTGRPAMGLAHQVEQSIQKETFAQILDPSVPNWPLTEALSLANLALQCAQLSRKDRPDLATVLLPQLQILRDFARHHHQQPPQEQEVLSEPNSQHSGSPSTPSPSSTPTEDQPIQGFQKPLGGFSTLFYLLSGTQATFWFSAVIKFDK
ncbi:U-box domain-containing protein 35 isoform X2 [Vigna angularis]|uniref:U-box domain-containing protein 35 isoform X2 n=1 Tax=Phaseolus angularis TaxID=3914 RepID=UPI0008099FCB|nr:U-box domain-containing protein 35 isoform X2 [Vigna angularis]